MSTEEEELVILTGVLICHLGCSFSRADMFLYVCGPQGIALYMYTFM